MFSIFMVYIILIITLKKRLRYIDNLNTFVKIIMTGNTLEEITEKKKKNNMANAKIN